MNGHRTPRRASAGPTLLSLRQRASSPVAILVLVALLLGATLMAVGCGDDKTETSPSTMVSAVSSAPTTAAEPAEGTFPVTVTDDNGKNVTVDAKPMRIVSTAPASTEILFALGVGDRVVGVSSMDDYPPEAAGITKIGDFQANTEAVMALSPDLVVGHYGNEEALAPVQASGAPVIIFNPATLDGVYANITTLGAVTGAAGKAAELIESLKAEIKTASAAAAATGDRPRVFYALDNTLWTCGAGSFVDDLLSLANCVNLGSAETPAGVTAQAYYQFSPEQLVAADPDVVLLPGSSGYKSAGEFTGDPRFAGLKAVKEGHVYLFDDTTVTRPGPRIGRGLKILVEAIHPGAF